MAENRDNTTQLRYNPGMKPNELNKIRKKLGLSQAALGEELNLSTAFVSMMERGVSDISAVTERAVLYLYLVHSCPDCWHIKRTKKMLSD